MFLSNICILILIHFEFWILKYCLSIGISILLNRCQDIIYWLLIDFEIQLFDGSLNSPKYYHIEIDNFGSESFESHFGGSY